MEPRSLRKTPKWGWYCHEAFDRAAKLGAMELITYLALTRIASKNPSAETVTASLQEIADCAGTNRRTIARTIQALKAHNLVQSCGNGTRCSEYKLLLVAGTHSPSTSDSQSLVNDSQSLTGDSQSLVYSVANNKRERNKSRLQREFVSKEEEYLDASATPLGAGADCDMDGLVRTTSWKSFVQQIYDLENS
jgi:hypothetical protein